MSSDKQIAVIGVSDEETAHLRLLMRKAASELSHAWRWGSEQAADLIIVDPASFAGQMARTRVIAAGMRCATFTDDPSSDETLVLHRPLKIANVIAVLNHAAAMNQRPEGIVSHKHDFYHGAVSGETQAEPVAPAEIEALQDEPAKPPGDAALGLEDLLRVDPIDAREAARIKTTLQQHTTVFGTSGPTARSEVRGSGAHDAFARTTGTAVPNAASRRSSAGDHARHSLRMYLEHDILGGPARITLPDAPALVLDPKQKVFHCADGLSALQPYCRTALRLGDWQALTSGELAELRSAEPAQPYLRLIWLYVLVHSEGHLGKHLDPGGTYRLVRWIEIERDFSAYFRIASSMLTPARLHEIAASSGASMANVFDVVNAYDAIGLIEWQPRAPRGGEASTKAPQNLMQRLRKSFKKS